MTSMTTPPKDPDAVLDYGWDWSEWLAVGETITSRTVTVTTGITKDSDSASPTAVVAWLSGGTDGEYYEATCHIVTSEGREDDRTLTIPVWHR
jgi:hypothetical protein